MTENLSELEKLKNATLLVEKMTQGRLRFRPSVLNHIHIHPADDAHIGLEMRMRPDLAAGCYEITFDAHVRRMGDSMDSSGLRALMAEVNDCYALLGALEMREYRPSQGDMAAFREFLATRQELAVTEQSGPVMGQTF